MNYVAKGWSDIKENLNSVIELYTKDDTRALLLENDYYKNLYGRAKNRTLIKENPKLYKSIYLHSQPLEDIMRKHNRYKGWYNFSKRIDFIVSLNCDVSKLRCTCGRTVTWNTNCRYCPEVKKTWLGRKHTKNTRKKQRISTLSYLEKQNGQIQPRYNINSIPIIEEYGKNHGYNFQHAENGGEYYIKELGYFLDAYDVDANVVLEVDEPHHYIDGELRDSDKLRQREIEEFLNCKFIRKRI